MGVLGDLEGALKSALPYALPAALGAGIGGPMGALAGVAAAQPDPDEMLKRQKEQLDIESEYAALQQATQQREAEQAFVSNPEFQQFAGRQMGIDPAHMPSFTGLPLEEVNKFLESVQKSRIAGNKLSNIHQLSDGSWAGLNEFGQNVPISGTPSNVVAERERGAAAADRQQTALGAASTRQKTALAAASTRQKTALAAASTRQKTALGAAKERQTTALAQAQTQKREQSVLATLKNAPTQYKLLHPLGAIFGTKAKDYADYLAKQLSAIPGITPEDAKSRAYAAAGLKTPQTDAVPSGFLATGRMTKDGKTAYYNPSTKKWWTPD